MILYGTIYSPYVRRVRLYMAEMDYKFETLDGVDDEDFLMRSPIQKVPLLEDGKQQIYDSRLIYNYLREKHDREQLSWDDENFLTIINEATDALLTLLQLDRSGIKDDSLEYRKKTIHRTEVLYDFLEQQVDSFIDDWEFPQMALLSLLEWAKFRGLKNYEDYQNLMKFVEAHQLRSGVKQTAPEAQK
ncbi:MAG: glutathione S-transferase family protein [Bacteriovoracaceae bacterium]